MRLPHGLSNILHERNLRRALIAIAIERVRLVEQRQQSEVARRSVEIKSALLTSLGSD